MPSIQPRGLRRAPPPGPMRGPTPELGNPLTVPERELPGYGQAGPGTEADDPEHLWLKMPPGLAQFFDVGFVHTENSCPEIIMSVRDDDGQVNLSGPPYAFAGLARVIVALCESVPCLASHMTDDAYTDQPAERAG